MNMVEYEIPQLVGAKERLGGLDRVDIMRVALWHDKVSTTDMVLVNASTYLVLQSR